MHDGPVAAAAFPRKLVDMQKITQHVTMFRRRRDGGRPHNGCREDECRSIEITIAPSHSGICKHNGAFRCPVDPVVPLSASLSESRRREIGAAPRGWSCADMRVSHAVHPRISRRRLINLERLIPGGRSPPRTREGRGATEVRSAAPAWRSVVFAVVKICEVRARWSRPVGAAATTMCCAPETSSPTGSGAQGLSRRPRAGHVAGPPAGRRWAGSPHRPDPGRCPSPSRGTPSSRN